MTKQRISVSAFWLFALPLLALIVWVPNKYLIDHQGKHVQSFASAVAPDEKRLQELIHKPLDARKTVVRKM